MSDDIQKLKEDLLILVAMAEEMDAYLQSDVLFWPMATGGLPKLTLGGYLMRQHRLLALSELLTEAEQVQLDTAVVTFNKALVEKIVRLETKAHKELGARNRQWHEYLKDLERDKVANVSSYATAVDTRAMIDAILDKLQMPPYELNPDMLKEVRLLDNRLAQRWTSGEFVWPEAWQPAYSRRAYWWLYGSPR